MVIANIIVPLLCTDVMNHPPSTPSELNKAQQKFCETIRCMLALAKMFMVILQHHNHSYGC